MATEEERKKNTKRRTRENKEGERREGELPSAHSPHPVPPARRCAGTIGAALPRVNRDTGCLGGVVVPPGGRRGKPSLRSGRPSGVRTVSAGRSRTISTPSSRTAVFLTAARTALRPGRWVSPAAFERNSCFFPTGSRGGRGNGGERVSGGDRTRGPRRVRAPPGRPRPGPGSPAASLRTGADGRQLLIV